MKPKCKIIIIVSIIVVLLVISATMIFIQFNENIKRLDELVINNVNLSEVADGTYYGKAEYKPIIVEVKVIIKDNKILSIEIIKHDQGKGLAANAIINSVIEKQLLDVPFISGATYSSKAILKAIENALQPEN